MKVPFRKIFGFLLSGGLASATYAVVYWWLMSRFAVPAFICSLVSFLAAIPVSYFGHRWITYRSRNEIAPESARFIVVQGISLVTTAFAVHVAHDVFRLSTTAEIGVAFVTAPLVSLILYEIWVYRQAGGRPVKRDT